MFRHKKKNRLHWICLKEVGGNHQKAPCQNLKRAEAPIQYRSWGNKPLWSVALEESNSKPAAYEVQVLPRTWDIPFCFVSPSHYERKACLSEKMGHETTWELAEEIVHHFGVVEKSQGHSEIFPKSEARCCNITLKYHLPCTLELGFLNWFGVFVSDFPSLSAAQCRLL